MPETTESDNPEKPDNVYSILHGVVDDQIENGIFVPSKAAQTALDDVLALDNLTRDMTQHIAPLVIEAMTARAKTYLPGMKAAAAAAERDVKNGQIDFADLAVDFSRMIRSPVGLDESPGTVRLPPIEMTLPQLRQHCELVRLKAVQNLAKIALYERFIDRHPEWEAAPDMKLSQILNLEKRVAA